MEKRQIRNIYKYYSAQAFVKDAYEQKKQARAGFSVRAWAKSMALKSHTVLHAVIKGTKKTPLSLHLPLAKNLGLSNEEAHYLLLLINIENSKDEYSRGVLIDKLETLKAHKSFKMEELADFEVLSDPFWGALMEMTDRGDFVNDPKWISEQSLIPKTPSEIKEIVARLLEHGFLKTDGDSLSKTHRHVTNVHDLANVGSKKYHRNCSALASAQVVNQSVEEREFNGYALNIRKRDIPRIKSSIRSYIKNFIIEFEASPKEGDATYQFNTQFFSLTRTK